MNEIFGGCTLRMMIYSSWSLNYGEGNYVCCVCMHVLFRGMRVHYYYNFGGKLTSSQHCYVEQDLSHTFVAH